MFVGPHYLGGGVQRAVILINELADMDSRVRFEGGRDTMYDDRVDLTTQQQERVQGFNPVIGLERQNRSEALLVIEVEIDVSRESISGDTPYHNRGGLTRSMRACSLRAAVIAVSALEAKFAASVVSSTKLSLSIDD